MDMNGLLSGLADAQKNGSNKNCNNNDNCSNGGGSTAASVVEE